MQGCFVSAIANSTYFRYSSGCVDIDDCLSRAEGVVNCSYSHLFPGIILSNFSPYECVLCCAETNHCNNILPSRVDNYSESSASSPDERPNTSVRNFTSRNHVTVSSTKDMTSVDSRSTEVTHSNVNYFATFSVGDHPSTASSNYDLSTSYGVQTPFERWYSRWEILRDQSSIKPTEQSRQQSVGKTTTEIKAINSSTYPQIDNQFTLSGTTPSKHMNGTTTNRPQATEVAHSKELTMDDIERTAMTSSSKDEHSSTWKTTAVSAVTDEDSLQTDEFVLPQNEVDETTTDGGSILQTNQWKTQSRVTTNIVTMTTAKEEEHRNIEHTSTTTLHDTTTFLTTVAKTRTFQVPTVTSMCPTWDWRQSGVVCALGCGLKLPRYQKPTKTFECSVIN